MQFSNTNNIIFISGLSYFIYLHLCIHTYFIKFNFHLAGGSAANRYNFFHSIWQPLYKQSFL